MGFFADIYKILKESKDKKFKKAEEKFNSEADKYSLFASERKAAKEFGYPAESFDEEGLEEDDYYYEDD